MKWRYLVRLDFLLFLSKNKASEQALLTRLLDRRILASFSFKLSFFFLHRCEPRLRYGPERYVIKENNLVQDNIQPWAPGHAEYCFFIMLPLSYIHHQPRK